MRHNIEKTEGLSLTKNECLFPSIAQEIIDDIITKVVENEDPLVEVVEEILIEEKVEIFSPFCN